MKNPKPAAIIASVIGLTLALGGITIVVRLTGTNGIAVHFYYLPIIYAAVMFGDYGAILVAMVAALACSSWMPAAIRPDEVIPQPLRDVFLRSGMFLVIALAASRAAYELRRRVTEAHTLYDVARSVTSTLRLRQVLDLITHHAAGVMNAKASSIRLLNEETDELELVAATGLSEQYWEKGPVLVSTSTLDQQVMNGESEQIYDVRADPRFQYPEAARQAGLTSVLTVPLETKEKVLGVVRVYSRTKRRFSRREVALLTAFAHQASVAIENARLYEDIRRNYYQTVRALTRAIEAKDSATYTHSERVTQLADELAQEVGMTEDQRELLCFGSILHDVGKIGLEAQYEATPEFDSEEGQAFYRMHPLIGRTILAPITFLEPILPVVLCHHEHWDASGFPEGLSDDDIPYQARLLSICDAYDRLRNPRTPDQSPLTPKEGVEQVVDEAGSRFDPTLVAAFRRVMKANHYGPSGDADSEHQEPLPEPLAEDE